MIKHRKHNDESISNELREYGFELVEFVSVTEIYAKDDIGYQYKIRLSNLRNGKTPSKFFSNPFAIDNLKLYLQIHSPNYKLLDNEYVSCKTKMRFICELHRDKGEQLNFVDNIVNNHHYCKYCAYDKMRDERVVPKETLQQYCVDRNVVFKNQFTKNHETQVVYTCIIHQDKGEQTMSLTHFKASAVPCRYCNISIGELKISQFLESYRIKYETEKTFDDCRSIRRLRFDFFLPDYNTLIEYDGRQHFEPVKFWTGMDAYKNYVLNQERDKIKDEYCKLHNYRLIRIPYTQFNSIDNILASILLDAAS